MSQHDVAPPLGMVPGLALDTDAVDDAPAAVVGEASATSHRHVMRGSFWFVAAVATGAAFSFGFWALAARASTERAFGIGTALWATVQGMNYLTSMGLPVAVARYGSGERRTVSALYSWALIYTSITSLAGTALFALVAPSFVREAVLDSLFRWGMPFGLALLFLFINGMAFALLVEVRLVTMRKWRWVFGRVLAVSLLRLPFLLVPAIARSPMGLLLLIAGAPALSGLVGVVAIRRATPPGDRAPLFPLPDETLPALRYASVNYVGMLAAQAPQFVLPLLIASPQVVASMTVEDFGPFYLAWNITVVLFLIPHTIGQVVLAEGSRDADHVAHQVRVGMRLALLLMVLAAAGVTVFAGIGTRFAFGSGFTLTAELLPRFVAAGIPWAVTCMCLARARVEADHVRTVVITVGFAVLTLVPAGFMSAREGVHGAANAWLLGNLAACAIAVVMTWWVRPSREVDLVASNPGA